MLVHSKMTVGGEYAHVPKTYELKKPKDFGNIIYEATVFIQLKT